MNRKCAIIGTDDRLKYLQEALSGELEPKLFSTMVWNEELESAINEFEPKIIFFPIHALKMERPFSLPETCDVVFVGKKYEEMELVCNHPNRKVYYYLEDEQWIWDNANLTAEGFINYFYLNEKQAIYDKQFIITGYGRVGKRLAFALHHLGAKVIISVRSEHQLYEAKSYGFQIETFKNVIEKQKDSTAYLINTIPSKWLINSDAACFKQVFDLASNPGCLLDSIDNRPENYVHATSLPGMFFPQDAGYLIATSVQTQLALLEGEK
ncbi:NAD(P)-dependent oxidoreductase [Psychrobacillus vulpis]|uniref:Dipicolinate synthase subunit A n=1 Tax=Psychrobacillus vulpis TaxID=2325572 RepID=A0A544TU78_9BACI|nr:NAD(P)-dependent oxidoreductase [Psychrobacillus vulpis]TQR20970.1 dipicolinate synthase subunit A [Psychrobacillus vulpis]